MVNLLESNKIGNVGVKYLSYALKHNIYLQKIDLSSNEITEEGAEYISEALKCNKTLKNLEIGYFKKQAIW